MLEKGFSKPTDRVLRLKQRIVDAVPYVESDRAVLVTQSYKETEDMPMVMRRAKALEKLLANLPVTIREDELIVGALTKRTRSVQIYPEFSYSWVQDEFKTMGSRMADPLQTSLTQWERFCFAMLDWGRRSGAGNKKAT